MKYRKIPKNATALQRAKWCIECYEHVENGGDLIFGSDASYLNDLKDGFDSAWANYARNGDNVRIVIKPSCRPYESIEEVPVGRLVVCKKHRTKLLITGCDENANAYINGSFCGKQRLLEHYTLVDGSPCGIFL